MEPKKDEVQGHNEGHAVEEAEEIVDSIPYDTGWAWMIVLGSFLMHTILVGYLKTFGILFVEIQELLQLTSSMTAWIAGIMQLVLNFISPLANILSDHFSSRVTVMIGGLLQAVALLLSAFAYDLGFLIATAGVIFGVGASLTYGPTIIMVGYYFKGRLALANSISLAGSSAGQFILPPLVTLLIDHYSIRGALIFLAGIMFNITLAGALLRPTSYYKKRKRNLKVTVESETDSCEKPMLDGKYLEGGTELKHDVSDVRLCPRGVTKSIDRTPELKTKHSATSNGNHCVTSAPNIYKEYIINDEGIYSSLKKLPDKPDLFLSKNKSLRHLAPQYETFIYASNGDLFTSTQNVTITDHQVAASSQHSDQTFQDGHSKRSKCCSADIWKKCLTGFIDFKLLKNPVFLLFALSCTCSNFAYIGQYRYVPARAKDLNISDSQRALLLSATGITDLIARIAMGCIADIALVQKYIGRYRLLAISMLLVGINSLLCPLTQTFTEFLIYSMFFGIFGGFYMTMVCVSLVDLLGREHLSRAWGIMLLLYGLMSLGEPLILGKLRDVTGSYDMSFRTCGGFFILASILIFCERIPLAYQMRRQKETKERSGEEGVHLRADTPTQPCHQGESDHKNGTVQNGID
ncbi:monocarboxylate transporter 12-B-like [Lineus longissimus]|uniref:monocarboxylate transporter 12-B-like n=1 Tax=Lineus longissimus TaxID=88925 RepID=UPI002B4DC3D8